MTERRSRGALGRWGAVLGAGLLIVAGGAAGVVRAREHAAVTTADAQTPVTAAVEWATLTDEVRLSAQLSYGDAIWMPASDGVITVLPASGSVIAAGQQVYEVDGRPVVLFEGERPFWRELSVDSDPGEDVRQLQQNLTALGYYDGDADGAFGQRTRIAVQAWQTGLGLPPTGVFSPADVVVGDSPSIRVSQVTARLGEQGISPATYTETTLRATARLTSAQARELTVGTPVTIVLPDGSDVDSSLSWVDPGGQPTGNGDETTQPSATIDFPDQAAVAESGPVAVTVVIRSADERAATLVVPVTALLATAEGGYAVETYEEGDIVRTPVEIGLVADARAQILRSGTELDGESPVLAEGDLVVLAR